MDQQYEFDDDSHTALGAAGVAWPDAVFVLRRGGEDAEGTAMTTRSDIQAALEDRDWSGAEVVAERPRAKIVHSVRLPAEWSEALEAEAERRGTTPSRLMQDFIVAGLQQGAAGPEGTVTISRIALHQALDAALTNAA